MPLGLGGLRYVAACSPLRDELAAGDCLNCKRPLKAEFRLRVRLLGIRSGCFTALLDQGNLPKEWLLQRRLC